MLLMIPWVYFVLPESGSLFTKSCCAANEISAKGVSLEEMDQLFGYYPHDRSPFPEDGLGKGEIEQRETVGQPGASNSVQNDSCPALDRAVTVPDQEVFSAKKGWPASY
jgi:hypothetical protein